MNFMDIDSRIGSCVRMGGGTVVKIERGGGLESGFNRFRFRAEPCGVGGGGDGRGAGSRARIEGQYLHSSALQAHCAVCAYALLSRPASHRPLVNAPLRPDDLPTTVA